MLILFILQVPLGLGSRVHKKDCLMLQDTLDTQLVRIISSPISDLPKLMHILLSVSSPLFSSSQFPAQHITKGHVSNQGRISLIPKSFGCH